MTPKLKRRKVEDGAYEVVDQTGAVIAKVEEMGNRYYRWRVTPTDRSLPGWDTNSITDAIAALTDTLSKEA